MAANDVYGDVGHEIQKQDPDLVNGHAPIVKGIELSRRQAKPTPVQPQHPIMGQRKGHEPQDQDQVIEDGAPQEEITECEVIHGVSRRDS
jgi:hypothetical protein